MIKEKINTYNSCPECTGSIISIKQRGENVCNQCGLIISERELDFSHNEIRTYNKQDEIKKQRLCPPISPLLPDLKLCTIIDEKEIYNPELKRAVKRDSYISWKSKNILIAITELKRIAHNLNLPDYIKEDALRIYKKALKMNILKGRSIIGMIAACIYYVCKEKGLPRTFQEILNETSTSENKVKSCYKTLIFQLHLKVHNINPISLIPKYIADLGLDIEVERIAVKFLLSNFEKVSFCGKDPKGLCAGAIYFASKIKNVLINQRVIAEKVGVTVVTLRSRYKELKTLT
ncbi:MAG: transcription initiation factor IIB family protein [Promethearchaeota archaeon]